MFNIEMSEEPVFGAITTASALFQIPTEKLRDLCDQLCVSKQGTLYCYQEIWIIQNFMVNEPSTFSTQNHRLLQSLSGYRQKHCDLLDAPRQKLNYTRLGGKEAMFLDFTGLQKAMR